MHYGVPALLGGGRNVYANFALDFRHGVEPQRIEPRAGPLTLSPANQRGNVMTGAKEALRDLPTYESSCTREENRPH